MTIQIKDVNVQTGEEIVRDATAEEIAQIDADAINIQTKKAEAEAKANKRAELLSRLGITEEEARILLG